MRACADDSFVATVPDNFDPAPCPAGYLVNPRTVTALRLRYVTPHQDDWVGDHDEDDGEDGPIGRRAVFWLVDAPPYHSIIVQVGTMSAELRTGDWILFDDSILHSVFSSKLWRGCAYQVRPIKAKKDPASGV